MQIPRFVFDIIYDVSVSGFHFLVGGINVFREYSMVSRYNVRLLQKVSSNALTAYRSHSLGISGVMFITFLLPEQAMLYVTKVWMKRGQAVSYRLSQVGRPD